jgi:hypothetical protein
MNICTVELGDNEHFDNEQVDVKDKEFCNRGHGLSAAI